jgi:predicted transcriptional regulator
MDDEYPDWSEENREPCEKQKSVEIQKLFAEMERKAQKMMNYLVLEGFLEAASAPGIYKYTPEGLVMAQQQYKKMQDEGLL